MYKMRYLIASLVILLALVYTAYMVKVMYLNATDDEFLIFILLNSLFWVTIYCPGFVFESIVDFFESNYHELFDRENLIIFTFVILLSLESIFVFVPTEGRITYNRIKKEKQENRIKQEKLVLDFVNSVDTTNYSKEVINIHSLNGSFALVYYDQSSKKYVFLDYISENSDISGINYVVIFMKNFYCNNYYTQTITHTTHYNNPIMEDKKETHQGSDVIITKYINKSFIFDIKTRKCIMTDQILNDEYQRFLSNTFSITDKHVQDSILNVAIGKAHDLIYPEE